MPFDDLTTQLYVPAREAVLRLAKEGVVKGLDEATLNRLRAECWDDEEEQMEDAGLLGILTSFYETQESGAKDGFYWRDDQFWNQTEDVVAELARLVPPSENGRPILRQRSITERLSTAAGKRAKQAVQVISLERDDGAVEELQVRSLDDVVYRFNELLRERGRALRIVPLDTSGEWRMYVAMDPALGRRLLAAGVLPIDDLDSLE
jgi:hypothetical protein